MTNYPPNPPPPSYAPAPPAPATPKNWLGATALALAVVGLICSLSIVGGVALGTAAVVFAGGLASVAALNWRSYGVFRVNEVAAAPFRHAYGAPIPPYDVAYGGRA